MKNFALPSSPRLRRRLAGALALAILVTVTASPVSATLASTEGALTLDEALRHAEASNSDAGLARIRYEKSDIAARQARDAASHISDGSVNSYQKAQQKYVASRQGAADQAIASAVLEQTLRGVRLQTESGYYGLWLAQERMRITETGLARAQEQLRVAKAQFDAGTVAKNDVLSAELQVASMEANIATAKRQLGAAQIQLNTLLGRSPGASVAAGEVRVSSEPLPSLEDGIQQAFERRAELVKTREKAAVREVDAQQAANYFPTGTYLRDLADLSLEEARLEGEQARRQVEAEVRQAHLAIAEADQRLVVAEKSVEQAREAFRLATVRYESGVATILEVTSAHVALYQAEAERSKAQFDLQIARAQYRTAIGVE